jgi:hypothetical protein
VTTTTTGVDGMFVLRGLEPDARYEVWSRPEPPFVPRLLFRRAVPLDPGSYLIPVHAGAPLRLRVLDEQGRGAASRVYLRPALPSRSLDSGFWETTEAEWRPVPLRTDPDGRLFVQAVPRGGIEVTVLLGDRGALRDTVLADAEREHVLPLCDASGWVEGVVTDTARRPVTGARVTCSFPAPEGSRLHLVRRATTTEGGRFRIQGVGGRTARLVSVQAPGFALERAEPAAPAPVPVDGCTSVRVVLQRTGSVTGRVVGDGGLPVARARVWLTTGGSWERSVLERVTDDGGRFRFPDLGPAHGQVGATAPGLGLVGRPGLPPMDSRLGAGLPFLLRRDDASDVRLTLRMRPLVAPEPRGRIEGRVTDTTGRPVQGAWVRAVQMSRPASQERRERATSDGVGIEGVSGGHPTVGPDSPSGPTAVALRAAHRKT